MKHHLKPVGFLDEKNIEYAMSHIGDGGPMNCEGGNGFLSVPFDKFLKGRRQPFP